MIASELVEEYGIPVFPCRHQDEGRYKAKSPLTAHGFKNASRSPEAIAAWWARWPDALVGVPTGRVSGIVVVDVDPDGAQWYAEHAADLNCARVHKTRRGHHLLYRCPDYEVTNSTGRIAPGVDTRGEGGYVIWWPAHGYETVGDLDDLTDLPTWLPVAPNCKTQALPKNKVEPASRENAQRIGQGGRNAYLTSLAGSMRHRGMGQAAIEAALLIENEQRCDPPLFAGEIRTIAASVSRYDPAEKDMTISITNDEGKPRAQAAILTDIGKIHQLFHDNGDPYVKVGGCVYAVTGAEYKDILSREYYVLTGRGANRNAMADAVSTLSAIAKFDGANQKVYSRVGEYKGGIVIDSGNLDCSAYHVTAEGWRAEGTLPVNFRRSGRPLPLPKPTTPDFSRIWKYVNVVPEHRVLVGGWLLSALRATGPYPILALVDEQGTGKSHTSRMLKRLTDPAASLLRSPPRDERDLQVAAVSSRVLALDNMSGVDHQLSDALCRLSTGGALSGRRLYTDSEEVLIEIQRPVILNGIDDLASRPDLAERCLHINLPPIEHRITEEELNAGFQRDAGAIFAALLDGLVIALATSPLVALSPLPRMADFAKWAAAGMPALGFTQEEFIAAYQTNQVHAIETGLDSSLVGQAIREFMAERQTWTGTAQDLLQGLTALDGDRKHSRAWPQSQKGLVNALRRLAPSLRHTGIAWSTGREGNARLHTLCKVAG